MVSMRSIPKFILILLLCSCENEQFTRSSGKTMGTYYDIQYKSKTNLSIQIDSLLNGFIAAASTYDTTSELSGFNKRGQLQFTSPYLPVLLTKAKYLHKKTNGAFEPTLMPLIQAHGFGAARQEVLSPNVVDSLLQ